MGLEDFSGEEVTVVRRDSKGGMYDVKLERTGEVIQTYGDNLKLPYEESKGSHKKLTSSVSFRRQLPRLSIIAEQDQQTKSQMLEKESADEHVPRLCHAVTPELLKQARRGSIELIFKHLESNSNVGDEAQVEGANVLLNGGTPLQAGQAAARYCSRLIPPESTIAVVAAVLGTCEEKYVRHAARHERGDVRTQKHKFQTQVDEARKAAEEAQSAAIKDIQQAYSGTHVFASDALKNQMARARAGEQVPSDTILPVFRAQAALRQARLQRAGLKMPLGFIQENRVSL